MRVLYVVSLFPCWSETFIVREIQALRKLGVDIEIFSIKHASEDLVQSDAMDLTDTVIYPTSYVMGILSSLWNFLKHPLINTKLVLRTTYLLWRTPMSMLKTFGTIARTLSILHKFEKSNIDHVHAHWATYPSTAAMVIGLNSGIPFSFTAHAHDIFLEDQMLADKFEHSKFVATISNFNVDLLSSIVGPTLVSKANVVHCGIDITKFNFDRTGKEANSLLTVGRFDEIKGFIYLVEACAELKKRGLDFTCRIIGDGHLNDKLKNRTKELGLEDTIQFLGIKPQEEVMKLLYESELFVLPSIKTRNGNMDGIPVALMEAMAVGTAVISTRVSGIPELISHQDNGLLSDPTDAIGLADNIEYLLNNKSEQEPMSIAARKVIEEEFEYLTEAGKILRLMES